MAEHSKEIEAEKKAETPEENVPADAPSPDPFAVNLDFSSPVEPPVQEQQPETQEAPASEPSSTIDQVKEFSEKLPMEKVQVPAAFPFNLLIEGELSPEEREKLVDVLSRESMGIREVDLEPQFAGNSVLIPRISEYAGVLLVQALRGTSARMRLIPTDDQEIDPLQPGAKADGADFPHPEPMAPSAPHPAELIVITQDSSIPQIPLFTVMDVITASATLNSSLVEAESSAEYQEVLENLQRELKYKAFRKGAVGLIQFQVQLTPLRMASEYRLTVSATAVRAGEGSEAFAPLPS